MRQNTALARAPSECHLRTGRCGPLPNLDDAAPALPCPVLPLLHLLLPRLLTCVPDLCLDRLAVDSDRARGELDADRALALEAKLIAGEPGEEVGLTGPRVTCLLPFPGKERQISAPSLSHAIPHAAALWRAGSAPSVALSPPVPVTVTTQRQPQAQA